MDNVSVLIGAVVIIVGILAFAISLLLRRNRTIGKPATSSSDLSPRAENGRSEAHQREQGHGPGGG